MDPRPALGWWLKVDEFVVGTPFWWRRWSDVRLREDWRWSFSVQGSVAVRRTTPVFKALRASPVVVSRCCSLVFSGDGEGNAVLFGRVFPLSVVLLYVFPFVICFI